MGAEVPPQSATSGVDRDSGNPEFTPSDCKPVYSGEVGRVGPVTGDPEKDNIGRVITDPCRR